MNLIIEHNFPHIFIPKQNQLWYPGPPVKDKYGNHLPITLDDIAGKSLEPSEYADLITEINAATIIGKNVTIGKSVRIGRFGSTFSPLDISGLKFWHDMLDINAYTTVSGAIDSITNKVSSIVTTQATSTQRPTFNATGFNGQPCGDYDGATTGDQFIGTESAVYNIVNNNNPYTLFYAAKHDIADLVSYVFGCGGSGTNGFRAWGANITGNGVWLASGNTSGGTALNVDSSGANNINTNIHEWWHTGTAVSGSRNGGTADPLAITQSVGATTLTKFSVGVRSRGGTNDGDHDGLIAEILFYDSELSSGNRSTIRQYMGSRWGVTVTP